MGFNLSPLAFDDIREAFDRALSAPKGIRIPCTSRGAAIVLRSRFNYYRKLDREENRKTYPPEHPMYGKSAYDKLVLHIPSKGHAEENVLFVEPRPSLELTIEEIN